MVPFSSCYLLGITQVDEAIRITLLGRTKE
jgi:hypothetical protein